MKCFVTIFALLFLTQFGRGDSAPSARSRSQQFIVHCAAARFNGPGMQPSVSRAPIAGGWFFLLTPKIQVPGAASKNRLVLDPSLVAVSCERIKEALWQELGLADKNAAKIHFYLNPFLREEEITIGATYYPEGWTYAVEIPRELDEQRFVKTVIEVLLIEQANRKSTGQPSEVPKWLVEGLAAHLQAVTPGSLALQMNLRTTLVRNNYDAVGSARANLRDTAGLTFNELSWPENLTADKTALYDDCAQLFITRLLRLKEGRTALRNFIENSSEHRNWQFSFLRAFRFQFEKLLDVEKWWALELISFTGRDPAQLWSHEDSAKKLAAALRVSVQLRTKTNALPSMSDLSIQDMIRQWDIARQRLTLAKTINQLADLRRKVQPEFIPLLDGYLSVLKKYLEPESPGLISARKGKTGSSSTNLKKWVFQQLDELDDKRKNIHPAVNLTIK